MWGGSLADIAALKAINTTGLENGLGLAVQSKLEWYFLNTSSSATADDDAIVAPTTGPGRWVRKAAGGSSNYQVKTANYAAQVGDRLLADTSAAAWALTLPNTASPGEAIPLACTGSLSTSPLSLVSSKNINGQSGSAKIVNNYARTDLIYLSDSEGWIASPNVVVFSTPRLYASNGDANGVLYYAGTNWGANGSWSNPVTLGTVSATATGGTLGGVVGNWMDREINEYLSNVVGEAYYEIDLKTKKLQLNRYSLRARNDAIAGADAPRTWKMQGLNGSTWIDLDSRANDATLSTQLQWANFGVTTSNSYSKFRFQWYGPNGSGRNIMALSEIELYGFLDNL
ncbi:hypothetical protein NDA01_31305 [Trichocoleus desertorum AS-A10]|uniref:hypothetical protein n=1 Tax=Trichocoleus desertorum TaxID=1481672 RepID=UPI0032995093